MKLLRSFPPLDASATIALCCQFVKDLPDDLYDQLARHVGFNIIRATILKLIYFPSPGMGFNASLIEPMNYNRLSYTAFSAALYGSKV